SNIEGKVQFESIFSETLTGSVNQIIDFPVKGEVVTSVPVQFDPKAGSTIDKKGTPDRSYNATEITWQVDFNKQLDQL
ncbi:hypothetical protein, partial [Anaerobacillus sp. 1_MG-2023]|uniref:hypothetical protein n=1 Tax=Anaerobacillus sp. 1_MG-2023 TaxID=3062655 RepID=UPI0026E3E74D